MSTEQDTPPRRFAHLGQVVMYLRQTAGISRKTFCADTNLADADLKGFETGRRLLTVAQRQRILRHPAMAQAHDLATASGIKPVAEGVPDGSST